MRALIAAVALALAASTASAQDLQKPATPMGGIASPAGVSAGWNSFTPAYCYGYAVDASTIGVQLVTTNGTQLFATTIGAQNAFMAICATNKRFSVYSPDGVSWTGVLVQATPGG